jgi:hypothetical protein
MTKNYPNKHSQWRIKTKELIKNGIYRHYKGNLYKYICVAKNTETEEELVIYQSLYGDYGFWARPKKMFLETVVVDGQKVERFSFYKMDNP